MGRTIFEISVPTSYVPISYHGIYHYRSGSTKQELKGAALQTFLLKKMGKSWDDIPVEKAGINDLDDANISYFLKLASTKGRISPDANTEDKRELLENLELLTNDGQLKSAAALLFAKNPKSILLPLISK